MTSRQDDDRTASLHAPVGRPRAPAVRLSAAGRTHPGLVRTNNEDSLVVADLAAAAGGEAVPSLDAGVLGPKGALLAVSDGMGGHSSGEVASGIAVEQLRGALRTEWSGRAERDAVAELRNDLRTSVDSANRAVLAHAAAHPESEGMGATLTAAVVVPGTMVVAHVGDSRCYLLRGGFLKVLTSDQSLAEELVRRGVVNRGSPAYMARRSVLTRVIGQKGILEPDTEVVALARGDRILLCSDGLHGPVDEETILDVLTDSGSPAECVETLVEEALRKGAPDNVTCLVAWVDGEGLPPPSALDGGGGTVSVAIDASAAGEDATLSISEVRRDATAEFGAADVAGDDTLAGTVAPPPPEGAPAAEGGGPAPPPAPVPAAAPPPAAPPPAPAPAPAPPPRGAPPGEEERLPFAVTVALSLLALVALGLILRAYFGN